MPVNAKKLIESGKTALGIEFGSTRIKAILIDGKGNVLAEGGHGWGFTSNEFRTDGKDRLDYCRGEFYTSLARFLESIK